MKINSIQSPRTPYYKESAKARRWKKQQRIHAHLKSKYDKKVKQAKKLNQKTNSQNSNMNIAKNLKKKASSSNHQVHGVTLEKRPAEGGLVTITFEINMASLALGRHVPLFVVDDVPSKLKDWMKSLLAKADKGWQRLAKAGKGWQRLAKAGKTLRLDEKFVGKGWQDFETG
ncbi:hypothetical protein pdam_00005343 [Pocillopora damicornis]|uniref:Uncharacterized protein n=1 Tax=Pocillopora damicornis TaxID=46731 RepID=A0A3M6U330_POCDA|nr:hypothetical protein pdam_00005343 [Pocillopora damicornis]